MGQKYSYVFGHFGIACRFVAGSTVAGPGSLSQWVQRVPCLIAEILFFEESLDFSIGVGGPRKTGRRFNLTEVVGSRLRCSSDGVIKPFRLFRIAPVATRVDR